MEELALDRIKGGRDESANDAYQESDDQQPGQWPLPFNAEIVV